MDQQKIVIVGGGGVGLLAAAILEEQGHCVKGFLNDKIAVGTSIGKFKKHPVIGSLKNIRSFISDPTYLFFTTFVGIGNKREAFETLINLDIPKERFVNVIDNTATIREAYTKIGNGNFIGPNAYLSVDTDISDNCGVFSGAYILHDSTLHRFSHVGANAVIGADVTVGKGAFVGTNATVKEKVSIGEFSIVGAGAVVIRDVPPNAVVAGNPAKILRFSS